MAEDGGNNNTGEVEQQEIKKTNQQLRNGTDGLGENNITGYLEKQEDNDGEQLMQSDGVKNGICIKTKKAITSYH